MAAVWKGKLPSELLTYYMPELRTRYHVTPADLYLFDVAATARWAELQHAQQPATPTLRTTPTGVPQGMPQGAVPAVQEHGDHLAIRGTEIPPWDPRYRGKQRPVHPTRARG